MECQQKLKLKQTACGIRQGILTGIYHAQSGHPGGSLSIADILAYLYGSEMNVRPKQSQWEDRDRLVLSKGHAAPALYAALAYAGFFPEEELKTLRQVDSRLQGSPDMLRLPGVDMSTGSLGQGFSAACGIALAGKMDQKRYYVYAILGDGELEEGQIWEAAMFAAFHRLDHLIALVDYNQLQIDGALSDVSSVEPIDEKFRAFGWNVLSCNAHDFDQLEEAIHKAKQSRNLPSVIVCHSKKGKGISFMEDEASWHGAAPNMEEYRLAMSELNDEMQRLLEEETDG